MPEFDFGSLKVEDVITTPKKEVGNVMTDKPKNEKIIKREKKSRISSEKLLLEINNLKKAIELLKQNKNNIDLPLPEEVYNGLWIMCRSFRSQYRNKSDTMLGHLKIIMNNFHIDLDNNPFDKLKGSE